MLIYIPLCFYLYIQPLKSNFLHKCHLHSTMLLLIPMISRVLLFIVFIYIPLCFYLYSSVDIISIISNGIYIPLCFYLYSSVDIISIISDGIYIPLCFYLYHFNNFVHASNIRIYIPLCFYLYRDKFVKNPYWITFTFHYASTYTYIQGFCAVIFDIYIPLCFYLYVIFRKTSSCFSIIYIPLCFYLYTSSWGIMN